MHKLSSLYIFAISGKGFLGRAERAPGWGAFKKKMKHEDFKRDKIEANK